MGSWNVAAQEREGSELQTSSKTVSEEQKVTSENTPAFNR